MVEMQVLAHPITVEVAAVVTQRQELTGQALQAETAEQEHQVLFLDRR